jgi:hypothetical protein
MLRSPALSVIDPRHKQCRHCWAILPIETEYCRLCEYPPERADPEDPLPGPRRRLVDEADELLAMDEAHDTQDCYGSPWVRTVVKQREAADARQDTGVEVIGDIPDSERGDR